ncbi:MAG: hypothetical protein ABMA64_04545 [Myxococcota bacterium]
MRWWWLVGAVVGCGGPPSDSDSGNTDSCTSEAIQLEVGTGEMQFLKLAAGDPVTLVHGPQGGWHVWTAIQSKFSEPEVSILPSITVPSMGGLTLSGDQQAQFVALLYDEATCDGAFAGLRAYVDTDQATGPTGLDLICALEGVEMELCVNVTDIVDGRSADQCVTVTAELDAVDVPNCP